MRHGSLHPTPKLNQYSEILSNSKPDEAEQTDIKSRQDEATVEKQEI